MSVKFKTPIDVDGQVSTEYIDLSTTTTHSAGVGEMVWNDTDGTVDIGLKGGNVKLQVGQEQLARVVNKTSPLITLQESNYQVVIITGATGQRLSVKLAQGNNDANSAGTLGVVTETILPNQEGFITTSGVVREINTTGSLQGETWSDGDLLFLSPTTAGAITNIRPVAPNHTVNIGYVEYAHAVHGKIYVKIDNGYELGELHDVDTSESKTTPVDTDNLLLQDSADQSVWKKLSWSNLKATLKSYFDTIYQSVLTNPITGTGTTNYVPKFTGSTTLGNSQIFDNGTNVGIGDSNPGYKLTVIGNGYFNDNVLIGNGSQLRFTIPGINIKPELVSSTWSDLSFSTNNSEKMRITSAGNVGIGTTSPFSKLEISGSATSWSNSPSIVFSDTTGLADSRRWLIGNVATDYGSLNFAVSTTNSDNPTNPKMTITKDGNVGIGTTSPAQSLDVNGLIRSNRTSNTDGALILGTTGTYLYAADSGGYLASYTANLERMRITSAGNVGIGTTSPLEKFVVSNSGAEGIELTPAFSSGVNRILSYNRSGAAYSSLNFDALDLRLFTSGSERMRITSDGNVGIGTSSPSSSNLLEVNGRAFTNQLQYTRAIDITSANLNDYTTAGFYNGSGLVNAPGNGWWWITVERYTADAGWAHQTATSFGSGNTPNQIYTRTNSGGTWTNWKRLIDWTDINGTTNYVSKFTGNNSIGNSQIFDNGTFVGFGTTSPNSILDVREANRIFDQFGNINVFTSNAFAANIGGSIALGGASNTSGGTSPYPFAKLQGIKEGTGNWAGALILGTTQSNSAITEKMRITSAGNVGIGTTSPTSGISSTETTLQIENGNVAALSLNNSASRKYTIYSGVGGQLGFYDITGGAERITLNSSGNVGIGTSSPSEKLDIVGNARIQQSSLGGTIFFGYTSSNYLGYYNGDSYYKAVGNHYFESEFSYKGVWNSAGNLGIGTTSVSGNSTNRVVAIEGLDSANLVITETGGATAAFSSYGNEAYIGTSTNHPFYMYTNGSERMRITSTGNVGIGTSSPAAKLDVNGTIKTGQKTVYNLTSPYPGSNFGNGKVYLRLLPTSNTVITTLKVTISGTWNWAPIFGSIEAYYSFYNSPGSLNFAFRNIIAATGLAADNLRLGNLEYENGYLSIPIYSSNSNDVSVTVECFTGGFDLSGLTFSSWISESLPAQNSVYVQTSLGIGTSSPGGKLHVVGEGIFDDGTNGRLTFGNASGQNDIYSTTTGFSGWKNLRLSSNNLILATNGTTEAMRITSSGNVGIGTSSPSVKLEVVGNLKSSLSGYELQMYPAWDTGVAGFGTSSNHGLVLATNSTERIRITSDGRVGIGASSPTPSSILELKSNTKGFLPPRMSEGERSSIADPVEGLMVWDTDAKSLYIFDGSDWLRLAYA